MCLLCQRPCLTGDGHSGFRPTNPAAAKPYGYQSAVETAVYNPLFPQWLCSVTICLLG